MMNLIGLIRSYIGKISSLISHKLTPRTESILLWGAVGIAIRFLLMPILASGDFMTTLWVSFTLVKNNQLILSNDPPAIFFLLGGFFKLILPFFPSEFFQFITSRTSFTPSTFQLYGLIQPGINSVLFLSKIPFLLFDVFSAFLILHLFSDKAKALTAFKIWILNPIVIIVSYVIGQFDIFPVFFMILALYFLKRKKFSLATLAIGFGAIFKIFTLALLPLVAISFWKTLDREAINIRLLKTSCAAILGLLPLLSIPIILFNVPPYYESVNFAQPIGSWFNGFFGKTLYTRGTVGQPFYSGLLSFLLDYSMSIRTQGLIQDFIYFIPFVYAVVLLGALFERQLTFERTCKYFTVFLLAYYSFSLFHVQWFLWVQPFLVFLIVENRKIFGRIFVLLLPLYFIYTFQWNADLTSVLLTPIIPEALYWPGPITLMTNAGLPALQIISLFRTFFSAICVFTIFHIVKTSFWKEGGRENES